MPKEIGYFHPDRQDSIDTNFGWLDRNSLLRRSTHRDCIEIYEAVAAARDEQGLASLAAGDTAGMEKLEADADRLRLISKVLREHFETGGDGEYACLFVDYYEGDVLATAENYWYDEVKPLEAAQSG